MTGNLISYGFYGYNAITITDNKMVPVTITRMITSYIGGASLIPEFRANDGRKWVHVSFLKKKRKKNPWLFATFFVLLTPKGVNGA